MNKPITVFVDSDRATARVSGPLVLGDTYAVTFSGLSTEEAAGDPEMIVLGAKPGEIAARSGEDGVLAMNTKPCVDAFGPLPPPPLPRPKQFPHPPPLANPPVHWRGGPHGSTRMHFYVVAGGQTLAQGDLVLLWAPFEFDEAGEPIQLRGEKGDPGEKGEKGDQGVAGRNGVYVAMDGLYAFHISQGGDHPENGHLWIHAQDESTLYAKDQNGNYLEDSDGNRIPLYYVGDDGHLRYRFFFQDSTHVELDLGKVVTREGLYAFHVSDGSDGEPAGHLMLHGQDLSQLYARDGQGNLILDGDGNPIPLFHIDANGHLHFTFYGNDGQAHESLDLGDVRGPALTWADLTDEQKAALKGEKGDDGDKGDQGDPLTWDDLTEEQKAALKGEKGDDGEDGMSAEQIESLVLSTMGEADDAPTAGSKNWVTSGGLWSVEMAILARIAALKERIDALRQQIGAALHFKGSVATFDDLPENADAGDCYNVIDEGGMNYAWTGSEWDALGSTIDLSAYRTAAAQDAIDETKYEKPSGGIPATDLAPEVQSALTDARTPTAHTHPASDITGLNLSQITSPDGDTTVKANNDGTATITAPTTGYGDAVVSFPDGFSVGYGDETYTAPSGGETIRLVGPYEVGSYTFYVPSTVQNPESFDPSQQSVWCVYYFTSNGAALMFGTGPFYTVSNWDTASPSLSLNTGTASGGSPSMTRAGATATKTVATVDQIPAPVDISTKAEDEAIAPAFSANETYAVGDYCVHNCRLYKCKNATSGSWNSSDWDEVNVMDEMGSGSDPTKADSTAVAPAFSESSQYVRGDYVTHEGQLYKCSVPEGVTVSGAWDAADWSAVAVTDEMGGGGITGVKLNGTAITPDAQGAVDVLAVPWANAEKNAVTIGKRKGNVGTGSLAVGLPESYSNGAEASGKGSLAVGNATASGMNSAAVGIAKALSLYSFAAGSATADGQNGAAFGSSSTSNSSSNEFAAGEECNANGRNSIALGYRAKTGNGTGSSDGTALFTTFVWNQSSTYYHSKGAGTFCINPNGGTAGFYIGNDSLATLLAAKAAANERNYLAYSSTTTLDPATAVYRSSLNADGTFPTITDAGIPTAAAYYQFELELTVPSTVPATITGPSGWTWLDGHGLPDPADLSGGETICISVRLDCTARTFLASVWRVA